MAAIPFLVPRHADETSDRRRIITRRFNGRGTSRYVDYAISHAHASSTGIVRLTETEPIELEYRRFISDASRRLTRVGESSRGEERVYKPDTWDVKWEKNQFTRYNSTICSGGKNRSIVESSTTTRPTNRA